MKRNAVFTIAAKNYLPYARTLGDSIKLLHNDIDFYILLSDEIPAGIDLKNEKHQIIEFKTIRPDIYKDMAFKYDVLEFSTAIKPFFIDHLLKTNKYEKIIYLDPDIYVFNKLDAIYDMLRINFVVLTPHFTKMSNPADGAIAEDTILFVGTYNLGFVAFKNCDETCKIVEWWKTRLINKCYADRIDALHVDQKWMDLIPACFDSGVLVSRHPGINISHCNMHERILTIRDSTYFVDDQPLIFFHYTGFDPYHPENITNPSRQTKLTLSNKPEYRSIMESYAQRLFENGFKELKKLSYAYSKYDNGLNILSFHRRLYRKMVEDGLVFENPFSSAKGSFFSLLKSNGLIINDIRPSFKEYRTADVSNAVTKKRILHFAMKTLKRIIGIKTYLMLLKFVQKYSRYEEQVFLISKTKVKH